jgi:hypothetical protein
MEPGQPVKYKIKYKEENGVRIIFSSKVLKKEKINLTPVIQDKKIVTRN